MNSTTLARDVVRQLIEAGVSEFVLSPGSRNAPLSIALYQAEQAGLVNLSVRIDERGAAFYALGISKASDNYVAVICTSGTAAANFHPAALEAYHSDNKLLVITADRPARLRRTGANQTTLQGGVLAPVLTVDISSPVQVAPLLQGGPVHLNVQFDEPLLSEDRSDWLSGLNPKTDLTETQSVQRASLELKSRGLIIVGHDRAGYTPTEISNLARSAHWPLIAEDPLSFSECIPHAALFLSDSQLRKTLSPEQVIVIGRTTLSRSINALINESPDVIVVDPRISNIDTMRSASALLTELPAITAQPNQEWQELWSGIAMQVKKFIHLDWSEQLAVSTITSAIPANAALFIGSSRPVRDIEAFADGRNDIFTFANRGLAGIDGNISCAFGIATQFSKSYAILGDITFLHDISALVNKVEADLTIFIIDNNGGGIFSTLPQSEQPGFEKLFGTPHGLDLYNVIAGFGVPVSKVKTVSDIQYLIAHQTPGLRCVIVEVPDRTQNAEKLREMTQRLVSALRIGSNLA